MHRFTLWQIPLAIPLQFRLYLKIFSSENQSHDKMELVSARNVEPACSAAKASRSA
jgi:hypothetical protein